MTSPEFCYYQNLFTAAILLIWVRMNIMPVQEGGTQQMTEAEDCPVPQSQIWYLAVFTPIEDSKNSSEGHLGS